MGNFVILEPLIVNGNADGTAAGLRGKIPLGDAHSDDEDDDESKSQRKSLCQKSGWQRKAVGIKPPTCSGVSCGPQPGKRG